MADIIDDLQDDGFEFATLDDMTPEPAPQANPEPEPEVTQTEVDDLPEKYRGKSAKDIAKMHQEAEKLIGRHANEIHELRQLSDQYIKQQLAKAQEPQKTVVPEVDFFVDPQQAVAQAVENHPAVRSAQEAAQQLRAIQFKQNLESKHPDAVATVQDPSFVEWVKASQYRMAQYAQADSQLDFAAADDLLSTWKELKSVRAAQEAAKQQAVTESAAQREQQLKAATVNAGGSGESAPKYFRRADIIRLMNEDPDRYAALEPEIMKAYAEKRVK